eukprot:TRINITY_DN3855_c0_g2_i6.p1 TRINITY_DN3855_c0_g2~~TRINITY_DN3855_c0_g2_i6.p1  ORF type:complete len:320 (-),score=63.10 TRINITY_DN3855_c0_g2_i6:43-1002(-)
MFAQELLVVADVVIGFYQELVVEALEFASKDRVLKVQQAARGAAKEWKKLKEAHKDIEAKKMLEEAPDLDEEELIKLRLSKDYQKLPQRTHEINAKGEKQTSPFLRKRMGTGGGYVELEGNPQLNKRRSTQPITGIPKNYSNAMRRYTQLPEPLYRPQPDSYGQINVLTKEEIKDNLVDTVTFGNSECRKSEVMEEDRKGECENAYSEVLKSGDDFQLLRLMVRMGEGLSLSTSGEVLQRMNNVVRSNLLPSILIQWISHSITSGEFYKFSRDTQNELLDTLYEFSQVKSEWSEVAGQLYVEAINCLNPPSIYSVLPEI